MNRNEDSSLAMEDRSGWDCSIDRLPNLTFVTVQVPLQEVAISGFRRFGHA